MFSPSIFEFVNKIEDCLECVKVSNRLSPRAPRAAHSDYYQWDLTSENIKNKTGMDRMLKEIVYYRIACCRCNFNLRQLI